MNPSMLEYKIPTIKDMPPIKSILVESVDPDGPYGAKEAGMSVAMSAAQAYCRAVGHALGIYFNRYPLTGERILDAIKRKKEHGDMEIRTAWDLKPATPLDFVKPV